MKESAGRDMVQSMRDLLWTEWQWDGLYSKDLSFLIIIIPPMLNTHSFVNQ